MLNRVKKNPRLAMHAWAAVGISCLYAIVTLRNAFETPQLFVIAAAGVIAMLLFGTSIHSQFRLDSVNESIKCYAKQIWHAQRSIRYAVGTSALTLGVLALAIQIGATREENMLALVEGIRTGVFILVGLSFWRLTSGGRLLAVAVWIVTDVWVFASVVVPGIGSGPITLVSAILSGWALLVLQDLVDHGLGGL
jgi:hypothetical protein